MLLSNTSLTTHRTQWITRMGILLALAISIQLLRLPQLITGSLINALLFLAVMLVGTAAAALLGIFTPLTALLAGILAPPLAPLVPFIMAANAILAGMFGLLAGELPPRGNNFFTSRLSMAVLAAAVTKFVFLYAVTRWVLSWLHLHLPPAALAAFQMPQLYTALMGGVLALFTAQLLSKHQQKSR